MISVVLLLHQRLGTGTFHSANSGGVPFRFILQSAFVPFEGLTGN